VPGVFISTSETVGEAAGIFLGSVTHLMPKKEK
jgi:hypothetical protein